MRRADRFRVRHVEGHELAIAYLGAECVVDNGVFVGHLVRSHGLSAGAADITESDGAVGIHVHVAEADVIGVADADGVGEGLLYVSDAIPVIVSDGDVLGVVDLERRDIAAFATLFSVCKA